MSDEKKLQLKRTILSELNKELSQKTSRYKKAERTRPSLRDGGAKAHPLTQGHGPRAAPARLHQHKKVLNKFDAQGYVQGGPHQTKKEGAAVGHIKSVSVPEPKIVIPNESDHAVKKYTNLWRYQTFGESTDNFRIASDFQRKRTLTRMFKRWTSETYVKQNEWKLLVRADCHFRFYLKERSWDKWRKFVNDNKSEGIQKENADNFCRDLLQRRYFWSLKRCVALRKAREADKAVAGSVYERNLLSRVFGEWHKALAAQLIYHEQSDIALQFWSLSLQQQCLEKWIVYKNEQLVKKKMNNVVIKFYEGKLVHHTFTLWVQYRQHRRVKDVAKKRAEKHMAKTLAHKFFYLWHDQAYLSAKTRMLEDQIAGIRNKVLLREMVLKWRVYREIQLGKIEAVELSTNQYRKTLLRRTFSALRNYTTHQKQTVCNKQAAEGLARRHLLRSCLTRLVVELDRAEEDKLKYRTLMARRHYQLKLLKQCVLKWAVYKDYRLDRKECQDLAEAHYLDKITEHAFSGWYLYLCYRRNLRVKKQTALSHHADLMNHKYFYTWLKQYHLSQHERQDERIALLHYHKNIIIKYFYGWKIKSLQKQDQKEKEGHACEHYQGKLLRSSFNALRTNIVHHKRKRELTVKADGHYLETLLRSCVLNWTEYSNERKMGKAKQHLADKHYYRKLQIVCWDHWTVHHQRVVKGRHTVQDIRTKQDQHNMLQCLRRWGREVKCQKEGRDLNLRADLHYQHVLGGRVLRALLGYVEQQARDHVRKVEQVETGREVLNRLRQRHMLRFWRDKAQQSQHSRILGHRAEQHHHVKLQQKGLRGLKGNVKINLKNLILRNKLQKFLVNHSLKSSFETWKQALEDKVKDDRQNDQALWFWCYTLEHRVLRAWVSYTQYRKQRQGEYHAALQNRKHYLIQSGLRHWIKTVTDAETSRSKAALEAVTLQAYRSNEIALKWGKHWLNLIRTTKPRKERSLPRSSNKENNVIRNIQKPNFYEEFKKIKSNRPTPKIPSFFVDRQYLD